LVPTAPGGARSRAGAGQLDGGWRRLPCLPCPQVLVMAQRDRLRIAAAARQRAAQFSVDRFYEGFGAAMARVLPAG
jgi:hypothetical protein